VSNLEKEEAKKKKQKKMNPPPVTTAPTTAAFPRVSMSPSSGGNAGGCNAAMGSSSLDEASGHSPDTAVGRSPDAAADDNWCGKITKSLVIVHSKLAAVKSAEDEMREAGSSAMRLKKKCDLEKEEVVLALRKALHEAENEAKGSNLVV
jgi:hypothetical protein